MIIFALVLFISLYILNLPYFIGLIIVLFGLIFYFSNHRSFTHSLIGIILLSFLNIVFLYLASKLLNIFNITNSYLIIAILIALLSFLFLNKKLLFIFLPTFFISLLFLNNLDVNFFKLFLGVFLGSLSHLILDSFTLNGIRLFTPLSSKRVYKKFGIISVSVLLVLSLYFNKNLLLGYFMMLIHVIFPYF